MMLLAVDTSSGNAGQGSLALARDDGWCEAISLPGEWKSATLHRAIAALLDRHGLKTSHLDGYAVANGPGTFTGLRIGLTAVKALAELHSKPMVTISTLEVMATAARNTLPATFAGSLAVLFDARRGQIFGALFRSATPGLVPVIPDCVCSLKQFLDRVRAACSELYFCSTELQSFVDDIAAAGWSPASLLAVPPNLAATLARMGIDRLRQGGGVAPEAAEANYVRRSDAELFWKG